MISKKKNCPWAIVCGKFTKRNFWFLFISEFRFELNFSWKAWKNFFKLLSSNKSFMIVLLIEFCQSTFKALLKFIHCCFAREWFHASFSFKPTFTFLVKFVFLINFVFNFFLSTWPRRFSVKRFLIINSFYENPGKASFSILSEETPIIKFINYSVWIKSKVLLELELVPVFKRTKIFKDCFVWPDIRIIINRSVTRISLKKLLQRRNLISDPQTDIITEILCIKVSVVIYNY